MPAVFLDFHPEVGMVASRCLVIDEDGRPVGSSASRFGRLPYNVRYFYRFNHKPVRSVKLLS